MEQYFFKITASYSDKNKLYAAFREHVSSLDGTLIKDKETRELFIAKLFSKKEQLNKEFSRCKPISMDVTNFTGVALKVEGSWSAIFYEVERSVELKDHCLQYFIPDNNYTKETEAINFGTWYSGMDRSKVKAAFDRFLKESDINKLQT